MAGNGFKEQNVQHCFSVLFLACLAAWGIQLKQKSTSRASHLTLPKCERSGDSKSLTPLVPFEQPPTSPHVVYARKHRLRQ